MLKYFFVLAFALWSNSALAACGPDAPPAIASAYGLTCETFHPDMTNAANYDVNNTQAPGFAWYTRNDWPNAASPPGVCGDCTPTLAADYTINGSGLTLAPIVSNNSYRRQMFNTCAASSNAAGYIGTAFSGSFYLQITYTVNYAAGNHIAWMNTVEYNTMGMSSVLTLDEVDIFEDGSFNASNTHEWIMDHGGETHVGVYTAAIPTGGASPAGILVVAPARNGGTYGLYKHANSDIAYDTMQFGPTVAPIGQSGSTVGPIGGFKHLSTDHYCLMLSNYATGSPYVISSVKVWQAPNFPPAGPGRRGVIH